MLHHYTSGLLPNIGDAVLDYSDFLKNAYLWVDFFFILSGFVLAHVYGDAFGKEAKKPVSYKSFMFARFARIYPLHILMLVAFVCFDLLGGMVYVLQNGVERILSGEYGLFPGKNSGVSIFTNLTLLQFVHIKTTWNEPSWSISAEWFAYFLFPFIISLYSIHQKKISVLIYASLLAGLFVLIRFTYGHLDFAGFPSIIRCVIEGALGIVLYALYRDGFYRAFFQSSLVFISILVGIVAVLHFNLHDIFAVPLLSLLVLAATVNRGVPYRLLNSPLLNWLGNISYSVYMTHWFIMVVFLRLWLKVFQYEFGEGLTLLESSAVVVLFVTFVLAVSSLTYKLFELPMRIHLKKGRFAQRFIYS